MGQPLKAQVCLVALGATLAIAPAPRAEQTDAAAGARSEVRDLGRIALRLQRDVTHARGSEETAPRAACLEERLTQVGVLIRGLQDRLARYDAATRREDRAGARTQLLALQSLIGRARTLRQDLVLCQPPRAALVVQVEAPDLPDDALDL